MIVSAVLGLGSNLADPLQQVKVALSTIGEHPEIQMELVSSCYSTAPIGVTQQPEFVNAVCIVSTTLSAEALLTFGLDVERRQGRVRNEKWGPRIIDIDILMYQDFECRLPHLTIPHPELLNRSFWLIPLAEIAPSWMLPNGQMVEKYVGKWDINSITKI